MKKKLFSRERQLQRAVPVPKTEIVISCSLAADDADPRQSWVFCLALALVGLTEARDGRDVLDNLKSALYFSLVLQMTLIKMSKAFPCCLESNLNKVRIARYANKIGLATPFICALITRLEEDGQVAALPGVIETILEYLPGTNEIWGVAADLGMVFCRCQNCKLRLTSESAVIQCRHCAQLLQTDQSWETAICL